MRFITHVEAAQTVEVMLDIMVKEGEAVFTAAQI
jgi:hypothetical protein